MIMGLADNMYNRQYGIIEFENVDPRVLQNKIYTLQNEGYDSLEGIINEMPEEWHVTWSEIDSIYI